MGSKRKLTILGLVASLALFAITTLPSSAAASDKDCADFATQRAAQIFFLKHGGPQRDPHRLDGDDDGVACEDNPCPCYYRKHLPRSSMRALARREFVFFRPIGE